MIDRKSSPVSVVTITSCGEVGLFGVSVRNYSVVRDKSERCVKAASHTSELVGN